MRVVLEIVSGPHQGQKTVIKNEQPLTVGRSDLSNVCCASDERMSRLHFQLKVDAQGCQLSDRASRNGTFVNGVRVIDCFLRNGDHVEAGETIFVVHFERDSMQETSTARGTQRVPTAEAASDLKASKGQMKIRYTAEACNSGLTLYLGDVHRMPPVLFAYVLSRVYPLHLIVYAGSLGMRPPEELGPPQYLNEPVDPAQQADAPILISPGGSDAWEAIIEEGWDRDSVVCVFSSKPAAELLAHLRAIWQAGARAGDAKQPESFFRPGVLCAWLTGSSGELVSQLMASVDAILLESATDPEAWQLFGGEKLKNVFKEYGIKPKRRDGSVVEPESFD